MVHLWLRAETKKNEHRTALTPSTCMVLQSQGIKVTVERCTQRIFPDDDYSRLGCPLVEKGSWKTNAPSDAFVIGLKELPENDTSPLSHPHIFFAHCYKKQSGWKEVLQRFDQGGGLILDMEFLNDENGRRVAAFGYHAGFAGAAVGLNVWSRQQVEKGTQSPFPAISPYPNEDKLIAEVKQKLEAAKLKSGHLPKVLVMGALGRCGTGACDFLRKADLPEENIIKWDMAETAKGGPFPEILDADIFVNCIYLSKPIPPFFTMEMLDNANRRLTVVVDVSCDATNPHNPIPVYNACTTFDQPCLSIATKSSAPLEVVAIDHLPTMLPRESSEAFSHALIPSLRQLTKRQEARVWVEAEKLFHDKVKEMKSST